MNNHFGFMQGRLSPIVNGKIQSFPWLNWQKEFLLSREINLNIIEWTIDHYRIYENPIMTVEGQEKIKELSLKYDIKIPSLTADCVMQFPFWKFRGEERQNLQKDLIFLLHACVKIGVKIIVIPLVDNGKVENNEQEVVLCDYFLQNKDLINNLGLKIAFESDLSPIDLQIFIKKFDKKFFGLNYDIGNSASFGYDPNVEFDSYGDYILNVHIKDRLLNGETIELGKGNANFPMIFKLLNKIKYNGNYILQIARDNNNDHIGIINKSIERIFKWMK